jgi:hypothetical protein
MRNVLDNNGRENQIFYVQELSSKNRVVYEMMSKNMHTHAHTAEKYIILTAFLRKHLNVTLYVHCFSGILIIPPDFCTGNLEFERYTIYFWQNLQLRKKAILLVKCS